jgi:flavin reductase (DIM6/NTAB) family NADH-FMN oxidoreductase RutF
MLCRLHQIVEVGETPQALVLGRIEQLYIADQITKASDTAAPTIDSTLLNPLARLGGDDYAKVAPAFTVQRPH